MSKKHKHSEVIKAWADGAEIEYKNHEEDFWSDCSSQPCWGLHIQYRIKPAEPEKVYPVSSMGSKDFDKLFDQPMQFDHCSRVANAAIRRAIDDGQVVVPHPRSHWAEIDGIGTVFGDVGVLSGLAARLENDDGRDLAVAKAIRSEAIRRSMFGDQRIKQAICDIDCRAIIAGVK